MIKPHTDTLLQLVDILVMAQSKYLFDRPVARVASDPDYAIDGARYQILTGTSIVMSVNVFISCLLNTIDLLRLFVNRTGFI